MKIGVVIPDRNDRPLFLQHCISALKNQSIKPDKVCLVNHAPYDEKPDLTQRVRLGFETLRHEVDCVLIMENDDYYCPNYIESMVYGWDKMNRPEIFGINSTIYYHIKTKEYRILQHNKRASLMSTLISTNARFEWCADNEVFLDIKLWGQLEGATVKQDLDRPLAIGIKHGQGLCGGTGHTTLRYKETDSDDSYLKQRVTEDSFNFYRQVAKLL